MTPIRCPACNKMLAKVEGRYEIKCPRCGKIITGTA